MAALAVPIQRPMRRPLHTLHPLGGTHASLPVPPQPQSGGRGDSCLLRHKKTGSPPDCGSWIFVAFLGAILSYSAANTTFLLPHTHAPSRIDIPLSHTPAARRLVPLPSFARADFVSHAEGRSWASLELGGGTPLLGRPELFDRGLLLFLDPCALHVRHLSTGRLAR